MKQSGEEAYGVGWRRGPAHQDGAHVAGGMPQMSVGGPLCCQPLGPAHRRGFSPYPPSLSHRGAHREPRGPHRCPSPP